MLFFKTREPVEPVSFVRRICLDAAESLGTQKHRWIRRLTPMTRMGKATEKGLEEVSKAVLGPAFHQEGGLSKKGSVCFLFLDNATQYMQQTIRLGTYCSRRPNSYTAESFIDCGRWP